MATVPIPIPLSTFAIVFSDILKSSDYVYTSYAI